ncbi:IS1/IS1595 family N-terminal zinc-binding domain-containing protein [Hydrogenothermus marinus]|uniref:IS1/IS1595 family N-terminal zinc-binding domain-containing protein n=1 Tax=Hydrogenothermus marinus TaxID=133270 RepID=UPI000EF9A5FF
MRCVYCNSEKIVKNGKSNQGKQRYLCKSCKRIFVENLERRHYPKKLKDMAIKLYIDRVSIAAISRSLEVPYETVRSWIRAAGELAIKKLEARKNILIKKNLTKQD